MLADQTSIYVHCNVCIYIVLLPLPMSGPTPNSCIIFFISSTEPPLAIMLDMMLVWPSSFPSCTNICFISMVKTACTVWCCKALLTGCKHSTEKGIAVALARLHFRSISLCLQAQRCTGHIAYFTEDVCLTLHDHLSVLLPALSVQAALMRHCITQANRAAADAINGDLNQIVLFALGSGVPPAVEFIIDVIIDKLTAPLGCLVAGWCLSALTWPGSGRGFGRLAATGTHNFRGRNCMLS